LEKVEKNKKITKLGIFLLVAHCWFKPPLNNVENLLPRRAF